MKRSAIALGILALPVHAQGDGGQAAVEHPALVRLQNVAEHPAAAAHLVDHLGMRRIATPASRSLKPERYLVPEYSTRSAPSVMGC